VLLSARVLLVRKPRKNWKRPQPKIPTTRIDGSGPGPQTSIANTPVIASLPLDGPLLGRRHPSPARDAVRLPGVRRRRLPRIQPAAESAPVVVGKLSRGVLRPLQAACGRSLPRSPRLHQPLQKVKRGRVKVRQPRSSPLDRQCLGAPGVRAPGRRSERLPSSNTQPAIRAHTKLPRRWCWACARR
jgi:hypothetical protein